MLSLSRVIGNVMPMESLSCANTAFAMEDEARVFSLAIMTRIASRKGLDADGITGVV
jgi:hypothetical protein